MFASLTTHYKINPISLSHCYTLKQDKISGIYPGNLLLFVTRYGNAFFVTYSQRNGCNSRHSNGYATHHDYTGALTVTERILEWEA